MIKLLKKIEETGGIPDDLKKEIIKFLKECDQIEKELRKSKENYKLLFESVGDAIFIHDSKGRVLEANQKACDLLGYSKKELLKMKVTDVDSPEEAQSSQERIIQLIKNGTLEFETQHRHKRGFLIPIEVNARLINWENHLAVISVCRDITKRKKMREKLKESEKRYRTIAENTSDTIWTTDSDFNITYVNPAIFNFLGYYPEEFIGLNPVKFTTPDGIETIKSNAEKLLEELKKGNPTQKTFEVHQIKKNGTIIDVEITANPLIDDNGDLIGFQGRSIDITDQKKREEELIKSQKLESLGVLAGGIAHDFNNILTKILGVLSLLKNENNPKNHEALIKKAEQATIQGSNLSRKLLTFAKGGIPEVVIDSVSRIAKEAIELYVGKGYQVTCEFDLSKNSCLTKIDVGQIHQVFTNLAINAIQSMPNGGKIKVKAEDVELLPNKIGFPSGGKYVKVSVSDNGIGIPPKILSRIFDPYFTTKNEGSGLGLAITYKIIKDHKGAVTVDSIQGKGTTFHVYLPATKESPNETTIKKEKSTIKKKLKILIMDDQEEIRELLSLMLEKLGHQSILTANGEEALKEYSLALSSDKPFDLVFLDLTIPNGMSGKDTLKNLLKIDPSVLAIVSSGYSTDLPDGFVAGLGKPYTMNQLEKTINSIIERFNF